MSLLFLLVLPTVLGHGNMVMPKNWFDTNGKIGWGDARPCRAGYKLNITGAKIGAACMWFTNNTFIPGKETLPREMRTYHDGCNQTAHGYDPPSGSPDIYARNPWRSPGAAPIFSPCGVAGGNPHGCPVGAPPGTGWCPGYGYSYGPNAEHLRFPGVVTTYWTIGSSAEVAWAMSANHGGGYSYRLCKVPEKGVSEITEECFQQGVLAFDGDEQWIQYGMDRNSRIGFRANRTRVGTYPIGSQWTKVPIPACNSPRGGYYDAAPGCPNGTQFPPPSDGLLGFGTNNAHSYGDSTVWPVPDATKKDMFMFHFSLVDRVVIPASMSPGRYVLSFRWDVEQTPQVWTTCASVRLVTRP